MGGNCDGAAWVACFFEANVCGPCQGCSLFEPWSGGEEARCQVEGGQEPPRECPELADHIRFEGVKLYGVNKPPPKKMGWRL